MPAASPRSIAGVSRKRLSAASSIREPDRRQLGDQPDRRLGGLERDMPCAAPAATASAAARMTFDMGFHPSLSTGGIPTAA